MSTFPFGARRWLTAGRHVLRPQDFAWLFFVAVLIVTSPEANYNQRILLILIGAFQVTEPRLQLFASRRGQVVSVVLKIVLTYLLVGYTHGIESSWHTMLLLPILSAATTFRLRGVIIVTVVVGLLYASYVPVIGLYIDLNDFLTPEEISLICLRIAFYGLVAFIVYEQAEAKRTEMARTQETASELARTNRSLRRAEASLRRTERLAALGQLTAGLAHELRNPLGTIRASAEMLTRQSIHQQPELMTEMAGYIRSEADRVNGLISHFLDFARPLQIHTSLANLQTVLNDVLRQLHTTAEKRQVSISVVEKDAVAPFLFDPNLLMVALSNLIQNAIEASENGQVVTIAIAAETQSVQIRIIDRGAGIAREQLETIFNPFFTTKADGIGLGLALVAKIVDEHAGSITVDSNVGQGTTFTVTLPYIESEEASTPTGSTG